MKKFTRCHSGYACALRMVEVAPMTSTQLAEALGAGVNTVRNIMRHLHGMRLVRVAGWESGGRGTPAAVWQAGCGNDAPSPDYGRATTKPAKPSAELIAFGVVVRALIDAPRTNQDLRDLAGLHEHTVRRLLRALAGLGMIHITAWERLAHIPSPCWRWGAGRDAPRPRRQSSKAVYRRYYVRRRAAMESAEASSGAVRLHAWLHYRPDGLTA